MEAKQIRSLTEDIAPKFRKFQTELVNGKLKRAKRLEAQ